MDDGSGDALDTHVREGDVLYAYAVAVVGTVPGTPAGEVAARAVHDALEVAAAAPAPGLARLLALTRNECLRQLRARAIFVDSRADVWLPPSDDPADLVASALLGLPPGDRDVLAAGWVWHADPAELARALGAGTVAGLERRAAGAKEALARESGAVSLVADPRACPGLLAILAAPDPDAPPDDDADPDAPPDDDADPDAPPAVAPDVDAPDDDAPPDDAPDADGPILAAPDPDAPDDDAPPSASDLTSVDPDDAQAPVTPPLRDRVSRHADACRACGPRRREFLRAALPGFALPDARTLPPAPDRPAGVDVVARAGALDAEGFPRPLDHDDVVGVRWLRRAVLAGVASAGLLVLGGLLYLALAR